MATSEHKFAIGQMVTTTTRMEYAIREGNYPPVYRVIGVLILDGKETEYLIVPKNGTTRDKIAEQYLIDVEDVKTRIMQALTDALMRYANTEFEV